MSRVWAAYNAALEKNPLLVKALTSLTGFTAGDVLAQKFVTPDEEKGYDLARTLRLGAYCRWEVGLGCGGKCVWVWVGRLAKARARQAPK